MGFNWDESIKLVEKNGKTTLLSFLFHTAPSPFPGGKSVWKFLMDFKLATVHRNN